MADDQVFTMHRFPVRAIGLGHDKGINIIPISDVHLSSAACDRPRYLRFIQRCREEDGPNTFYLFGGDEDDLASSSERLILSNPKLHDATTQTLDDVAERQTLEHAALWQFARGRIIGVIQGNHHWRFETDAPARSTSLRKKPEICRRAGQTSTELFAEALGAKWLGWLSYIVMPVDIGNNCRGSVEIVVAHGRAGGSLIGTTINQVADMRQIFPSADIYLMGHDHQRGAWAIEHLEVRNVLQSLYLAHRKQFLGRMGSFLKSYEPGKANYIVRSLRRPANLGTIKLMVSWSRLGSREKPTLCKDIHALT